MKSITCLLKKFKTRRMAVSPLIATVLLIGLIVIGATIVGGILFVTLNAPTPVEIQVTEVGNFSSQDATDDLLPVDGRVDEFTIVVQNIGRDPVIIPVREIYLKNYTNPSNPTINGWLPNEDRQEIFLTGFGSVRLQMTCATNTNELNVNSRFLVSINGTKPENAPEGYKSTPYTSIPFTVDDITGPLEAVNSNSLASFNFGAASELSIVVQVKNWGSTPLNAIVELSIDSNKLYTNTSQQTKTIPSQDTENFTLYLENINLADDTTLATIKIKDSNYVYALLVVEISL